VPTRILSAEGQFAYTEISSRPGTDVGRGVAIVMRLWCRVACGAVFCAALARSAPVAVAADVPVPSPVPLNSNAASDSGDDTNVRLFSDGAERLLAVWESKDDLGGTIGTDVDLLYAWSDDQGQTWSAPATLNGDAATDNTDESLDELKLLGAGHWYALWHVVPVPEGTCTRRVVARSSDNGASWSAPVEVIDPHAKCSAMATNGQGTWLAAWTQAHPDHSPGCSGVAIGFDILVSRSLDDGATWSEPALLDAAGRPCGCTLSTHCAGHEACRGGPFAMFVIEGNWVLTWRESCAFGSSLDADFLSSTSRDDGQTWSAPTAISAASSYIPSYVLQLSAPSTGLWYMLWSGDHSYYEYYGDTCDSSVLATSVSRDAGATWTGSLITSEGYCHFRPFLLPARLVADSIGNLLVAWWSLSRLLVSHSWDSAATWSYRVNPDVNEGFSVVTDTAPLAAGDGQGGWALVWPSKDPSDGNLGTDADILVAFSRDHGARWTTPVALDPSAASDSVDDKPDAILAIGPGRWLVTWSGSLGGDYGSDKDILQQIAFPDCDHDGVSDLAEADSDDDGVIDACDDCPDDPDKTSPGVCGCGTADEDRDGDRTLDCEDECPDDRKKTRSGICGCATPDKDSDADGTMDCVDECPDDPHKSVAAECGCGEPDDDRDTDGTPDCEDECADDPGKTSPGVCGCGTADVDTDEDGVVDCHDNCPNHPNPDQADADGDGTGDPCTGQGCTPCTLVLNLRCGGPCGGTATALIGATLLGLIRARRRRIGVRD
jgi:hypothetical protein